MKKLTILIALAAFCAVPVTAQLATSGAVAAIDNIPPGPVTELQALVASGSDTRTVALTWTLSADDARSFTTFGGQIVPTGDVRGYRVYRQQEEGVEELVATLGAGVSEFVDDVVIEGASYIYDVRPFDSDNETNVDVIPGSTEDLARIVLVGGASEVVVETRIEGELTFDSNLDLQDQEAVTIFTDELIRQLAEALGIDPSRIIITDIQQGSIVVSFQIAGGVDNFPNEPTPVDALVELKRQVQETQDLFATLAPLLAFVDQSTTVLVPVTVPVDADGNAIFGWFTREGDAVDFDDFFLFADNFGKSEGDVGYDPLFDISPNGAVDFDDFFRFADDFGKVVANALSIQG